jgi:hypothetical protein
MHIGLDFDNTIACYTSVFSSVAKIKGLINDDWTGSKQDLKLLIDEQKDGKYKWQALQGQVYGPSMHQANLFPGVARFLLRCKLEGHIIFIVSHKTKYGHFDNTQTLLRESALKWMEEQGFFKEILFDIKRKNIFFANNQNEKVLKIKNLNLDIFIDDLEEIFLNPSFPEIKKILFNQSSSNQFGVSVYNNWTDIEKAAIGEIKNSEIKHLVNLIYDVKISKVEKLNGRGNSRIYKLSSNNKNIFLFKDYPDLSIDSRPRMQSEVSALKLIENLNKTPKVIGFDKSMNFALFEWIQGNGIDKIENNHIKQALSFIENLQDIKGKETWGPASQACFSAKQLYSQISFRFDKLLKIKNKDLNYFLVNIFGPLFKKVQRYSEKNWPINNFEKNLPLSMQVFSPSDFGFHNAIQQENGE